MRITKARRAVDKQRLPVIKFEGELPLELMRTLASMDEAQAYQMLGHDLCAQIEAQLEKVG